MPQATDILLDGAGYMLAPGKSAYRRTQDGIAEGRTGRVQMKDFFGGQLRPYQLERDRFFKGSNISPASNGQAVRPWVASADLALPGGVPAPNTGVLLPACVVDDYIFIAVGTNLLRSVNPIGSTWAGWQIARVHGATIPSLCYFNGQLMIALGAPFDIQVTTDYPIGFASTALSAGERGAFVTSYGGFAIWKDVRTGSESNRIRMTHGTGIDNRFLDNKILNMVTADGEVWAITRSALDRFSGHVKFVMVANPAYAVGGAQPASIPGNEWYGEWEPFFQHGCYTDETDHQFFIGFGGRLYTNIGRFIGEFKPDGDRAGWRDTGLHYTRCFGACVAGGYLVVTIQTIDDRYQVWAWDGSGWWMILDKAEDGAPWCFPTSLAGIGGWDLAIFIHGSGTYKVIRLIPKSKTLHTIPASGTASFVSSMIDANERDKDKAWRKIGCVFADPDPSTVVSADAITVTLEYSVNAGQSWVTAATANPSGNNLANHQIVLNADIGSAAAVSRFLMLRVSWSGLVDWAPQLVDIWAEFELLDSPARRRKWIVMVRAGDQVVDRDGSQLAVTGRQLINQLWTDWSAGTTVAFRDIDYDDVSVQRNVRIIGIEEDTDRPADAGRWGESMIKLVLVEV